jgi:hypothetical protein
VVAEPVVVAPHVPHLERGGAGADRAVGDGKLEALAGAEGETSAAQAHQLGGVGARRGHGTRRQHLPLPLRAHGDRQAEGHEGQRGGAVASDVVCRARCQTSSSWRARGPELRRRTVWPNPG